MESPRTATALETPVPRGSADAGRLLLVVLAGAFVAAALPHVRGRPPRVAVEPVRIDLNRAPPELLRALPGVGDVLAVRIEAERAARPFASVEDLRRVPGVGPALVARVAPHATAGPPPR